MSAANRPVVTSWRSISSGRPTSNCWWGCTPTCTRAMARSNSRKDVDSAAPGIGLGSRHPLTRRPRGRYVALLRRNPELRRLYFSRLVSFGGDWFLLVPMLGLVNELSGSAVLTAAVLAANTLPAFLASPIGGVLADRCDRRRIMIWSNLTAAGIAATGMLLVDHPAILRAGISVPLALAGLAILAALSALISPASSAAIPAVVAPEDLADATFLIESTWGTMAAVGSAAGGLVSTLVGRDAAIAIDAISFLGGGVAGLAHPGSPPSASYPPVTVFRQRCGRREVCPREPSASSALTHLQGRLRHFRRPERWRCCRSSPSMSSGRGTTGSAGCSEPGVWESCSGPFLIRRLVGGIDRKMLGAIGFAMALWGLVLPRDCGRPNPRAGCPGGVRRPHGGR